jgi:hypothetical protein
VAEEVLHVVAQHERLGLEADHQILQFLSFLTTDLESHELGERQTLLDGEFSYRRRGSKGWAAVGPRRSRKRGGFGRVGRFGEHQFQSGLV